MKNNYSFQSFESSTRSAGIHSNFKATNRKNNWLVLMLLIFGLFANFNVAQAQLLTWNTFGNTGTETTEPSTSNNANISASNLTLGPGVTAAANGNRFGGTAWFNTGNTAAGSTLAEAIAGNDYYQFVVTPNSGFSFTPTTLTFIFDFSSTGTRSVTLRSSADGYTANLGSVTGMTASTSTVRTLTISGLSAVTTATTFRLYGYGFLATGNTGGFDCTVSGNNVILNGSTAATSCSTADNVTSLAAAAGNLQSAVSWTNGACYDEIMVVASSAAFSAATPSGNGSAYTANSASFTDGLNTTFDGGKVVYKGTGTGVTVTSLTNGTTYNIRVFTRKGTTWNAGVSTTVTPILTQYFWDADGATTAATGGTGTWDASTTSNWRSPNATGTLGTWSLNTTPNDAVFAGTAGTVSTTGTITFTAPNFNFNTTGYTLASTSTNTVTLAGNVVLGSNVNLNLSPNVNIVTPANGTFNIGGNISGTGTAGITLNGAQSASLNLASRINLSSIGATISVPITISSSGGSGGELLASIVGTSTGTNLTSAATITNNTGLTGLKTGIGATSGNAITLNGAISGTSNLQFGAGGSGGAGTVTLNAANTYTGATFFNAASGGIIRNGIANALPSTSDVTMGYTASNGGIWDLNSFNQTIASLTSSAGGGSITNQNAGTGTSTLTVNGSSSPAAYSLPITNGTTAFVALTKAGTGTLTLGSTTNSYTGATTITQGELRLNPTANATFASQVVLNGGTLGTTGITATRTWTSSSTLNLNANSTIALGTGNHTLTFAASNGVTWAGSTLTITGWTGTAGVSGTGGKIFFGNSSAGLIAGQLSKISFSGYLGAATILSTGEIVPLPSTLPTLTPSVATITGLNYTGTGPSTSQSFTFSGSDLTGFPDNITVTAPTNFEVSTNNSTFFASVTYPYTTATLGAQTIYVRLKTSLPATSYGPSNITIAGGGATTANVAVSGTVTAVTPIITPSTLSLTGYSYIVGSGPSTSQAFTFTGADLTGFPSNITVTGSTNYEVSTNNSTFAASVTYPYTTATLTTQIVYVRLKTGLSAATYNENITISGGGISPSINISNAGSVVTPFSLGNLAAIVAAASASNTTASVIEVGTSAFQASPVSTILVDGTDATNGMRFSGSATSTLYVANSNDGTLLSFTGHNSTNTVPNANTLTNRAVVTYNNSKTFNKATNYTGSSGNQTRCATTLDNTNWFIGDQGGFFTNGASLPSPAGNVRGVKAFGGTVYAQSSTVAVGTLSAATGGTHTLLSGLSASTSNLQDFTLVASGSNGATYDVLYLLYSTKIDKYSLVAGNWTANGTYLYAGGGFGLTAKNIGIGSELYLSTGSGSTVANSIVKLTDNAGFNSAINITTASNLTLYTAAAGTIIKGLAFAPISATAPNIAINASPLNGFTYVIGSGPSAEQTFTVSGTNLGANPIALNVASDYEISLTSGGTFVNTLSLTPIAGSVASTTVYVRLKNGIPAGNYSNRLITLSTANAYSRYVILNGSLLPNVNVSVSAASGTEVGTTSITVTATATSALATDETVDVTLTGTSIFSGDYTIGDGDAVLPGNQIKILAGSTTGSISFTLVDDNLNEGTETASVNISNPSAGLFIGATSSQNVSITDNDDAVILPTIDVASATTNFNELVTTGSSTEVSKGAYYLETGTNQNLVYSTGDGSLSTGDTYAFGSGVSTDRALGSNITSALADVKVGFKIKNSTGASFNAMIVEYYGEQWRRGVTGNAANGGAPARDKLRFEYSTSATDLATGTWGSSSILNFNSPDFGTSSTETARNGNNSPFRQLVRDTIFIPSGVAANANLWVRWVHNTAGTSGARDGLGIDDVTFTPINFAPSVFYSDAIGSLDQLSTWWTNADGTGANPINFTSSNQIFIVQNRSAASIGANWSVSGTNSSVRIRDGVTVTIPDAYSFVGKIDSLQGTSTLILNNANTPILNGIEATSTVVYGSNSNQDIAVPTSSNNQYGNLTFSGAGVKRIIGGFRIEGEYLFNAVSMDATPTFSVVFFKKNITHSGGISYSTNYSTYVNLQAYGSSAQQLIGNGSTIKAGRLLMNVANTSGTLITAGADLKTGSLTLAANTDLTLGDDLKLNTNTGGATFADNANTITVGVDLECSGNTANYSFTGTMILNGTTGTINIRQDGVSGASVKAEFNNLFIQTTGTTITQVQPSGGGSTLVINGEFRIGGTSTGKFTPNGNTIQIAGDFVDSRTIDMIAPGTSTFEFNGSSGQNFSTAFTGGESFYNVVINNSAGLTLTTGNMRITGAGNLNCASGGITTGANKVILSSTASITETSTHNVLGNVESTRVLTNALNQFGGMGFEITALGAAPGSTVVLRNTGISTDLGCTSTSLLRTFTVTPTVNSGLNAVVTYSYLNSDLNSIAESSLALYAGTSPWSSISTSVNVASNSITATGLNSLATYVAAFASLPSVNTNSTTINASNPSRMLNILSPDVNTNYVWSPVSDLYTDSDLTIPYVSGASATTVYAAPFSSITYNVTATNTLIACTTSPVAIFVDVDPAITNDICAANSPSGTVTVTSTPTFFVRSLTGATASPGAACVAINKDIWFSAVVPSNGEIHVTTQEHNNPTASLNITSALVQIFTAATCSTGLSQVACNNGGAAANMAYAAATGLTPGSTVYIRLARTTANNAAPAQFIRMAVTKGLVWTGATNSDFTNPANYLGGDATSLTAPSNSSTVVIPAVSSNTYPIVVGTQSCHGLEFVSTFSNQNPNITISSGAELRLQASATYKSFINRSGFTVAPKINGTGTLRFNEGGINSAEVLCPVRFYGVVAVRNGVIVTSNGNMRFENNAVLLSGGVSTAVPTQNYNGTVTGNIVYVRSGSLYGGFNYWSSPVTSASTDVLLSSFGNNIYQYNNQISGSTSNTLLGWSQITTGITMTPGKGYIQTFAGNGTVTFTGAPNQAPLSIPTTVNGSNNFNLLGNPYPAALSYDAFKAGNPTLGSVYLWSNVGATIPYSSNSYVVMSSLGLAGNSVAGFTSKEIGPAQGFLTNVSSAGNINFSPNHVVPNYPGNTTQFLEESPLSIIRLRLSNPNQISFDALVGFGETGTEGVDFGYDSPRMPSSEILEVFTLNNEQQFTTQFLPNLQTARVVTLGTVMSEPGVHTFELNEFDNFDSSVRVYLEDALTGEFHNMNANSSYSFTNDPSFTDTRFRLHFMAPFAFNTTGSCSNDNTGKVIISNPNENYPMSAKIKNLSGEVVAENDSIMTEYIFTSLTPGAYSLEASYDGQDMISNSVNIDAFQAFEDINFVSSSNVVSIDQAIVEFSASESVNAQYTWNFGDGTILTGNSSVSHAFMQPGIYTVTLSIDNSGCVSTSSSEIIVTDVILGMSELANSNEIISFPNPANEQVNIFKSNSESASFEMTDVSGKVVLTVELNNKMNNINTSQLAPGVYTGTMIQNNSRKTIRIVIAH